jgi:hypothetical protein
MSQQYPPGNQWKNGQPPYQAFPYQQPGQYGAPRSPKPTVQQRWNRLPKRAKIGFVCGTLVLVLALCVCSAAASSAGSHPSTLAGVTATVALTAIAQPTPIPTKAPTSTPKPTATPTSVPTIAPTPVPTQPPTPTQAPVPTSPPVQGVNGNQWGYDFTPGNSIYDPNPGFCTVFACVSTFWTKTSGYVAECGNGKYTHSGGVSGACSRDGGVSQILYSH